MGTLRAKALIVLVSPNWSDRKGKNKVSKCDSPWENREKGERTGTRAMTRHAKRVTSLSDMRICNKQNKECHGRYCFAR